MTHVPHRAAAILIVLLSACASPGQAPPSSVKPVAPSREAVTPQPTAAPTPTTVELRPDATIPVSQGGHIIRLAAVGNNVWATRHDGIARINTDTLETTTFETPVRGEAATSFGATADAVWVGDWDRGTVYRLDPTTGAVVGEVSVGNPVRFAEAHGKVWIGSGATGTMVRIDPATTKATVTDLPFELVAGDSAWGVTGFHEITRVAIDTGEATVIDVPEPWGPGDCSVRGSIDSLWVLCHENDIAARIDPDTNSVMATLEVGSPVFGGVHAIDDWAFFIEGIDEAGAHDGRIVRVDLRTNQIDRIFELGPDFDPDIGVIAADALWVPIAAAGEVWRIPLSSLLVE